MDKFSIIYRILKILEKAMEVEEFDASLISAERLKINETLWKNIMAILIENGYVKDACVMKSFDGFDVDVREIKITLKGLEYLNENSLMKKAARSAKGMIEIIKP